MTKQNKVIPIIFTVDDQYVPFMCVALKSIQINASKDYFYKIHIINTGLNNKSVREINKLKSSNFDIVFNNIKEELADLSNSFPTRDWYSVATYYRLFIADLFPMYDKAIYLDADITVLGDISKMFNLDIGDNYVGAVPDEAVSITPEFIDYVNNYLGIAESRYFNAGVLLLNLKKLREIDFKQKFINLISAIKFTVAQDQDYLNVICKDHVYYMPSSWNKMPLEETKEEVSSLMLVHYNLSFKPWHYDGILYEEEFWKYAVQTSLINQIFDIKTQFTLDKILNDQSAGNNLLIMAKEQANMDNTFKKLYLEGKISF